MCVYVCVCVCASNVTVVPNRGSFDLHLNEQQRLNQPDKKLRSGNFLRDAKRVDESLCVCVYV